MSFCDQLYCYTESLPGKEKYNLVSQLEKCGVSIPSNIAEGSGKRTNIHFAEFLTTSLTSSFEAETQLLICRKRNYGKAEEIEQLLKIGRNTTKEDLQFQRKNH